MIRPADLIERKRNGEEHAGEDVAELVLAYARDEVPDYQMAAWCMAVYFNGLSGAETFALTDAMLRHPVDECRERLDLAARPEPGPLVVGTATEDDGVLRRDELGAARIGLVVPRRDEPVGSLGHAVEGQEVARDDLARSSLVGVHVSIVTDPGCPTCPRAPGTRVQAARATQYRPDMSVPL